MTWKGKRTKSRGFRLLSDCNFDQARRAVWQVVNHRCFRQSEFYLIFLIKAWAQPFKLMQHVFMILKLNQLLNVTSVDWIISQQKKRHILIFVNKVKGVLASIIPWGCIIALDVPNWSANVQQNAFNDILNKTHSAKSIGGWLLVILPVGLDQSCSRTAVGILLI